MVGFIKFHVFPVVKDAALVVAVCTVTGLLANFVRPNPTPLIQNEMYQIFVPCPEPTGEVTKLIPRDLILADVPSLVIDARSREDFDFWHFPGSISIPFDYLSPVSPDDVQKIMSSGAKRVVVYGDGMVPDSGRELARELSGQGIKNVCYIEGGAINIIDRDDLPEGREE